MNKLFFTAAALGLFASATALPQPAMAQEWQWKDGACPSGYSQGQPGRAGQSDSDKCYKGSFGTYTPPTYGSITKANPLDRCPVGYWTNENDHSKCVSPYKDKAPAARLKRGGACTADEVDEWGVYCTSKTTIMTRSEAENTAVADVNIIFAPAGKTANQGGEYENTPGIVGIFGRKGAGGSAMAASSGGSGSASAVSAQCTTGSASGAAVGGALAGEAGAALGSMLGGFGKKKKKKEGC